MMDPKKLGALVEEHSKNPLGDMPEEYSNEEESSDEENVNMLDRGEELLTSMGEFGEELRESADIIVENAMDIGEDLTSEEPAPETEEAGSDMADGMPGFMQEGFAEQLADKERTDLDAIGTALDHAIESDTPEGEHSEQMASQVGGLLGIIGACCVEGEDEDDDDEDEGDEDESPEAEVADAEIEGEY